MPRSCTSAMMRKAILSCTASDRATGKHGNAGTETGTGTGTGRNAQNGSQYF